MMAPLDKSPFTPGRSPEKSVSDHVHFILRLRDRSGFPRHTAGGWGGDWLLHGLAQHGAFSALLSRPIPDGDGPRLCVTGGPLTLLSSLKGNLWEEMKEEGFSLDALGAFADSPLGCDLAASGLTPVSGGHNQSFPDVQVTGLYAAYSTPDSVAATAAASSQYLGGPGNKPIALL